MMAYQRIARPAANNTAPIAVAGTERVRKSNWGIAYFCENAKNILQLMTIQRRAKDPWSASRDLPLRARLTMLNPNSDATYTAARIDARAFTTALRRASS